MSSIIIGSNGYIGRHLSDYLSTKNCSLKNYDLQPSALFGQPNYSYLDIRDRGQFDQLPVNIEKIYFLAGLTGTAVSFDQYNAFTAVNFTGLLHLLDWMRINECQARIIFPSTRLVYSGIKDVLLQEESVTTSKTVYAATKLAAEYALQAYGYAFDLSYTVFRLCVPYGNWVGNDYSYGTLGFMLSSAKMKKSITLYGDGSQKRTFTHISDICRLMSEASSQLVTNQQIFNIGGENMSLLDVASIIANKYAVDIEFTPWPENAYRMESGDTIFDDRKLKSMGYGNYQQTIYDSI